nr:glycosyltransferase family 4 protein [Nodosilinea sp. LEGE 06152]
MRAAIKWSNRNQIPVILLSDSQYCDRPRNPVLEAIKGQWICRRCDAAFVAGASAACYLEKLGFPKHKIWRGYDVIDNHYFSKASHLVKQNKIYERERLGLPERFFLYVGRFSQEKNLLRLLEAFGLYQNAHPSEPLTLVLVGSGDQELVLKDKAKRLDLKNIVWPGFKQISELPAYYGLASAFILPSISEPWGLVINEAMACGLPILASSQCGAIFDLVFPGINGSVFNPWESQSINQSMTSFSHYSVSLQKDMGQASQRIIQDFSLESWAIALTDCIIQTSRSFKTSTNILA